MTQSTEQWRPVPGFEGQYEVSDQGRVRGLARRVVAQQRVRSGAVVSVSRFVPERMLRPGRASHGYFTVALGQVSYCVHALVAAAFIGPRPPGMFVCHNDGSRTNNALSNLRYDTPVENAQDSFGHGSRCLGTGYKSAKLTEAAAREIRLLRGKVSQAQLAKKYAVSPAAVQAVHDGRTWRHA